MPPQKPGNTNPNAKPVQNPFKIQSKSSHQEIITVRKPLYFNENPVKTRSKRGGWGVSRISAFSFQTSDFTSLRHGLPRSTWGVPPVANSTFSIFNFQFPLPATLQSTASGLKKIDH